MTLTLTPEKGKVMSKLHAKNQDYRSSCSGNRVETLFIDALKEKEKQKDNQYKLKRTMAIAISLMTAR